jgi:hypothetical protein
VIVRVDAADATQLTENVVPQIQKVDGITRTLTCSVVGNTRGSRFPGPGVGADLHGS